MGNLYCMRAKEEGTEDRRQKTLRAMAAKAALCLALRETKLSQNELARKLELDGREIRHMLDPRHPTKLARIQRVLTALGKRLSLVLEDAA